MARAAIGLWLLCGTVSCSGSTASNPDGNAGAGTGSGGNEASSSSGGSGSSGASTGAGGTHEAAGSGGSAGKPSAGAGGSGGSAVPTEGGAGAADAGAGGSEVFTGALGVTPAKGSVWDLPSGDPLNSTQPVLARLGDGIVLAGATADPKLAGIDAFDSGVESEAFLARLDHAGKMKWSHPLLPAGLPNAVAVTASEDIVVVAPYLPDLVTVSPYFSSDSIYLGKFSGSGTPAFEKELAFDTGTRVYALAVDGTGAIWLAGAQSNKDDFPNESMLLAKYDDKGVEQFVHIFSHDGSTCYVNSISANAAGDVVFTGTFNGNFNLGGEKLTTQATLDSFLMPNGFVARFDSAGKHVWSQRFGGPIFDLGNAVTWLPDGSIALAGLLSGAASVGGKTVSAEPEKGQSFVASLDGTGKASWAELATGAARAIAVEPDGSALHVAGSFDDSAYLQDRDAATGMLLRSAKAAAGTPDAYSAALDGVGSLWLAGNYTTSADFSNENLLSAASGVFLLRLDRAP
jgi:hypothetical protein